MAVSEAELEVYRQARQGQDKYIYFLLAAVGASIAFALNQSKDLALDASQWPLGLAVACWSGSFLAGCGRLLLQEQMLDLNQSLIRFKNGSHELLSDPREIPFAVEATMASVKTVNDKLGRRARWQYRLLLAGGFFYIAWHVYEMYLRSLAA